jgi:TnpA family transposase
VAALHARGGARAIAVRIADATFAARREAIWERVRRRWPRTPAWNRANAVLFYGKGGEIASNRRDERELSMLCLRILQAALVFVNTLMLQDVLADPQWAGVLTEADLQGLTPLFWTHVMPYGEVKLDMSHRLELSSSATDARLMTVGVA